MTKKRTPVAPDHYTQAFEQFVSNGAAQAPAWLRDTRASAIQRFADRGFPTTRQEEWRFTDVKPILRHGFVMASANDGRVTANDVRVHSIDPSIPSVVMVNGVFEPSLSEPAEGAGLSVMSLEQAVRESEELVRPHLMQHAQDATNPFVSLNAAFLQDGVFLHVKPQGAGAPIQLLHVFAADEGIPKVAHPRVLILVEAGASATVVEHYVTVGAGTTWTNGVTELVVRENARLDTYRIQDESVDAYHTASTWSWQERDSRLSNLVFGFGGAITRHDIVSELDGEGAESTLNGLSVLSGRQHVDYHTALDHAKPHCSSWEYFNGVFDDRARGVFNGRIKVRPGAQKTDAKQTNNNLLLSPLARADSQPQLEIYADDVKCTHGATLGPIDEAHLFYMQSRGLSREHAKLLLTYGFASEILNGVTLEPLRDHLDRKVRGRLQGEGEL